MFLSTTISNIVNTSMQTHIIGEISHSQNYNTSCRYFKACSVVTLCEWSNSLMNSLRFYTHHTYKDVQKWKINVSIVVCHNILNFKSEYPRIFFFIIQKRFPISLQYGISFPNSRNWFISQWCIISGFISHLPLI